ncbi:MAG: hypothetical protein ABIN01_06185 [Ferruginibacter sp.]
MPKIVYLLIFVLFFNCCGFAQTNPTTPLKQNDSLEILNQLIHLLDSAEKPVSYLAANISIGNRLFSINNNSINAKQSTTNVVIYSPSLGYFHKSGLGFTAGANLLNDVIGFGINQYSMSPSFDLTTNEHIGFGISYTHYVVKNKFSPFSSPIQNDFYTYLKYKKTWLQPSVAIGYSMGEYNEMKYKDTVINGTKRYLYDSINYKLNAFSIIFSAGHQFWWYGLLDKQDGAVFTPILMANAGSGKTAIRHNSNAIVLFNILKKRGRIPKFENNKFEMQSIGLNLEFNYTIGNFNFQPQLYVDYYLPVTDSKRFSQVFVFNTGYTF